MEQKAKWRLTNNKRNTKDKQQYNKENKNKNK
jgi:hypothetical protein